MNKRVEVLFVGLLLFVSFVSFSRLVKHGFLKPTDFDITVRLQDKIPARLDQIMDDGAILADPIVSSALVIVLTGWVFFKAKGKRKLFAFGIPLAFFLLTIIEAYGKNFVPHPGPPFFMVKHPTTIFPKFHVVEPYSYPSGHTARITFLALSSFSLLTSNFWLRKKNHRMLISLILISYVGFVAISRIYLGHHWLSDILGGVLLGASWGLVALALL